MATGSIARIEIAPSAEMLELAKAGRRNSSADEERMRKVRELLRQADIILGDLGLLDEEVSDLKSLPLDKLTNAVGSAIERQLNQSGHSRPYEEWAHMAALYTDVVIIREGLCHWRVPYTIGDRRVELAQRGEWTPVELSWTEKKDETGEQTGDDVVGAEQKAVTPESTSESAETPAEVMRSATVASEIKSVAPGRLRHYAVLWGNAKQRDLYGEWFTPQTQDMQTIFKAIGKLPLLYHHAMDNTLKTDVVGVVDKMGTDEIGLWVESQMDMANRYRTAIEQMVENKHLGTSSGTLPGARKVSPEGEIERWAIVEVSLTPTPAEPGLVRQHPVALVKAAYDELGLPEPDEVLTQDSGAEEARRREQDVERERLALLELSAA